MSINNYTEDAINALELARISAQQLNHSFIGSEHILLGLLKSSGFVGKLLKSFGVTEEIILPYIDTFIDNGRQVFTDNSGYTNSSKKILELALYEAKSLREALIDSRHILIAILREKQCFGARILDYAGVPLESLRECLDEPHAMLDYAQKSGKKSGEIGGKIGGKIGGEIGGEKGGKRSGERFESDIAEPKDANGKDKWTEDKWAEDKWVKEKWAENKWAENKWAENKRAEDKWAEDKRAKEKWAEENSMSEKSELEAFAVDLTELARLNKLDPLIGCEAELTRLIQTLLRKNKNNPVLIGQPGVGKSAIVEGFAKKIADGNVPKELRSVRIMRLDIGLLIAGTKYRGEFEERLTNILDEIDDNVILFIDEIHTIVGAGASEGSVDAANIMKPQLARSGIRIIGATTLEEYHKYIEKDAALERRFSPIIVKEPSVSEAVAILKGLRERFEKHHNVRITDDAIKACVDMSIRCMPERFLPDKAIDLMDEACSVARLGNRNKALKNSETTDPSMLKADLIPEEELKKRIEDAINEGNIELAAELRRIEKETAAKRKIPWGREDNEEWNGKQLPFVDTEAVAHVVNTLTGIPVDSLTNDGSERLIQLESILGESIFGQEEALSTVARAIRKSNAGLSDCDKPLCSLILAGGSGLGKTELANAISKELFPGENALIQFDMNEYHDSNSLSSLIGSPMGYKDSDEGGRLTESVRRKPYAVLFFEDIDKACAEVQGLILRMLESGIMNDGKGKRISFRNTIVLMSVNTGTAAKRMSFGFGGSQTQDSSDQLPRLIGREMLSNIDAVAMFKAFDTETLKRIAHKFIMELKNRLSEREILIEFDEKLSVHLIDSIEASEIDKSGARAIKNKLNQLVEDAISEALLLRKIVRNQNYVLRVSNEGSIIIENKEFF